MRLNDWMQKRGLNQEEFARLAGISQGHVSKLLRGLPRVSAAVALKVQRATRGKVKVSDLVHEENA